MANELKGVGDSMPRASPTDRLESWKEIAAYLKCSERTVRRWEDEGLPVRRRPHKKKAAIFAYKAEIDAWWHDGQARLKYEASPEEVVAGKASRWKWLVAGAALISIPVIFVGLDVGGIREILPGESPTEHIQSLAVLPLDNVSHDPEQEYFADGMTDQLITDLAQIGSLKVISRTSSMQYKQTKKSLPEIARELHVDAIVEGTVQRSGERVHITAQLIETSRDQHLWAKTYEGDLRNILVLENEVARSVAAEIAVQLTPAQKKRLASAPTVNREAYESYLKGRYFWNKRNPEELKKAVDFFQQAIDKQPDFAPALAGLADSYSLLGASGFDALQRSDAMEKARASARRALEMDDTLAEAHASMGYVIYSYDWDWQAAEKEFQLAITLNPNYPMAHLWYSEYLNDLGRKEEALDQAETAMESDPISVVGNQFVARAHYFARRFDQAIETSRKIIEIDPSFSTAHLRLGRAYAAKGLYPEAIKEFQEFARLSGDTSLATASIGNALARSDHRSGALRALNDLRSLSKQRHVPAICFALVYIGLGNKDSAMDWLESAYKERSDFLLVTKVDPLFDPMRGDPRFQALLRRMKFPEY